MTCTPCRGTGIYPLDIEAVESGRLRPEHARGCGACYGTFRVVVIPVVAAAAPPRPRTDSVPPRRRPAPATVARIVDAVDGDLLALAIARAGGSNPFLADRR